MKTRLLPLAALAVALAASDGAAQTGGDNDGATGTADDIDRNESPVIVDDRPPAGETQDRVPLRSESEAFVQIQGSWATERSACPRTDAEDGGGLYLTDTIIRWEGSTCSIRDIDTEDERSATISAFCTANGQRLDRSFELELSGEDTLSLRFQAEGEQYDLSLTRCERIQ